MDYESFKEKFVEDVKDKLYEQGAEVNIKVKRPKIRPYKTNNYYACLLRQAAAEREVKRIVSKRHVQKQKAGA